MDCSNPVDTNDRATVGNLMEEVRVRLRQDLGYVSTLLAMEERVHLGKGDFRSEGEVKAALPIVFPDRDLDGDSEMGPLDFLEEKGEIPVCGLVDEEGVPLHPPTVHQAGMKVAVRREFGRPNVPKTTCRILLKSKHVGVEELAEVAKELEYSYGSPDGFVKRLRELTTRKCVSVGKQAGNSLKRLLPLDSSELPDWNLPVEELLLEHVELTRASSAGAPTWAKKADALERTMQHIMPIVVGHMSAEGLKELRWSLPELFVCEVKNKLDRYEVAKLQDKTRPYVSQPLHFSMLFSFLSQSFTKCLKLCVEEGHNAYGLAYTDGRLTDLYEKRLAKVGRAPFFMAYGDDMDIFFRREGRLYRVSPDCRQMDGSVDLNCGKAVINYVVQTFVKKWGRSPFWEAVAKLWLEFSFDPVFLVDGTMSYKKKQKDGLMSGAVGTTLFDTAKALLCADQYCDAVANGSIDPLDKERSVRFFKKLGLEIKPETWKPEVCYEGKQAGELFGKNKFLGVRWMWWPGPSRMELVPSLEANEWLRMLAVPRDHPSKSKDGPVNALALQRTMFDRCRGLLITGAVFDERARGIIYDYIDSIPGLPIVMAVQAGGGSGERPEEALFLGGYAFQNSSGVPTLAGVASLYSKEATDHMMMEVYPGVARKLKGLKAMPAPVYRVEPVRYMDAVSKTDYKLIPEKEGEEDLPRYPRPVEAGYSGGDLGKGRPKKIKNGVMVERKEKALSFEAAVDKLLGDNEAVPVAVLCQRLGMEAEALYPRLVRAGLSFSSRDRECYVSKHPLREGEEKRKAMINDRTAVITTDTTILSVKLKSKMLERPAHLVGARIEPQELFRTFKDPGPVLFEGERASVNQSVQKYVSRCGYALRFEGGQCIVDTEQWAKLSVFAVKNIPNETRRIPLCTLKARSKALCQYAFAFACAQQAHKYVGMGKTGLEGTKLWIEEAEFADATDRQEKTLELHYDEDYSEHGDEDAEETFSEESEGESHGGNDERHGDDGRGSEFEEGSQASEEAEIECFDYGGDSREEEGAVVRSESRTGDCGRLQEVDVKSHEVDLVANTREGVREVPMGESAHNVEASSGNHSRRIGDNGDALGCERQGSHEQIGYSGAHAQYDPSGVGGWREKAAHPSQGQASNPQMVYYGGGQSRWGSWPIGGWGYDLRAQQNAWGGLGGVYGPYVWHPGMRGAAPWSWGAPAHTYSQCVRAPNVQDGLFPSNKSLHLDAGQIDGLSRDQCSIPVRDPTGVSEYGVQGGGEVGCEVPCESVGQNGCLSGADPQVELVGSAVRNDVARSGDADDGGNADGCNPGFDKVRGPQWKRVAGKRPNQNLEAPGPSQHQSRSVGFCRGRPCPGGDRCRCESTRSRRDDVHRGQNPVLDSDANNTRRDYGRTVGPKGRRSDVRRAGVGGGERSIGDRLTRLESQLARLIAGLSGHGSSP